jgi:hypothetical protein
VSTPRITPENAGCCARSVPPALKHSIAGNNGNRRIFTSHLFSYGNIAIQKLRWKRGWRGFKCYDK